MREKGTGIQNGFCSKASFFSILFALLDAAAAVAKLIVTNPAVPEIRQDIAHGGFRDIVQGLFGQKRLVGRDDHVGHGDQPGEQVVVENVAGAVLKENVGLLLVHVQAGRADFAGLDPLQQGLGVDQAAPGGVHEHHALLHPSDRRSVDHVTGLLRQRAVQGDDVGPLEQLVQRHVVDAAVRRRERIIGDDLHAEAAADVDEDPADLSGADDAHGLAVEIEARKTVQGEIEFPRAVVGLVNAAHGGQKQGDRVLRHGIGRVGGHVYHVDLAKGSSHVHVVVARRAQGDQLHPAAIQPVDDRGVHRVVHKDAHGLAAPCQLHGVLVQPGLQKPELHLMRGAIAFKGGLVVLLRVIERNLDHRDHSFAIACLPCRAFIPEEAQGASDP